MANATARVSLGQFCWPERPFGVYILLFDAALALTCLIELVLRRRPNSRSELKAWLFTISESWESVPSQCVAGAMILIQLAWSGACLERPHEMYTVWIASAAVLSVVSTNWRKTQHRVAAFFLSLVMLFVSVILAARFLLVVDRPVAISLMTLQAFMTLMFVFQILVARAVDSDKRCSGVCRGTVGYAMVFIEFFNLAIINAVVLLVGGGVRTVVV